MEKKTMVTVEEAERLFTECAKSMWREYLSVAGIVAQRVKNSEDESLIEEIFREEIFNANMRFQNRWREIVDEAMIVEADENGVAAGAEPLEAIFHEALRNAEQSFDKGAVKWN